MSSNEMNLCPQLDAQSVAAWLDNHPEFMNDYLKKMQLQRRSSIMNDKCSNLLATFHTSLLNHAYASNLDQISSTQDLVNASCSSSQSWTTQSVPCNTPKRIYKKHSIFSLINFNQANSNLNASFSEPNLPTESNSLQQISSVPAKRKTFKQLGIYEKMYTLVKTLYQSLDLKSTCKKILNTVSLLLDADRCSLFLVVDDEKAESRKCLVSVVFDAQSSSSLLDIPSEASKSFDSPNGVADDENNYEQIKIPYGEGIAGYVAATGHSLNISNAYLDSRFNSNIDKITGYRTKSILCLPILNELGECIAVAEAINKTNYDSCEDNTEIDLAFSQEDEETFSKFMPFIAIAIRNSNLYSQSRKEAQTNKVLLELATIMFDESSSSVDNLVSRILFNSLFLLECEKCQVILINTNSTSNSSSSNTSSHHLLLRSIQNQPHYEHSNSSSRLSTKCFDRVYELNYDELNNDVFSYGILVKPKTQIPDYTEDELDIISHVYQSSEILNIENVKDDPKYSKLHETTKAKSILCIPVINSSDEVIALIYACNKIKTSTLGYFSKSDINVAQAFALFCGIGVQNIMMYEKVLRASNMQQVALDVLSYHLSSNQEEVDNLASCEIVEPALLGLNSFLFDENTLDDLSTLKACVSMFADLGFIQKFKIPYEILCRFFLTVKKNYRPVAYHNWRHGFNVMSSMYAMLTLGKYGEKFSDLEKFSLLIACLCHDVDHRGTSNNFQIKIQSPLAKLYTTSTMEHHHFNQCIIILHNNMNNILMNLTPAEHSTAIEIIEKAILATDLSLHFKHVDTFLAKVYSNATQFDTPEDKELLLNMLMTAGDLSGGTKPWKCHYRLSNLVATEFFSEGDLEKEKFKMEPIDAMNRNKSDQLPQMQIQFLQAVCIPLYNGLSFANPLLKPMSDRCDDNLKEWQKLIKN